MQDSDNYSVNILEANSVNQGNTELYRSNKMPTEIHSEKPPNEKMVVPLDGSKLAEIALPYAEELSARTGSDITLLSVLELADSQDMTYLKKVVDATKCHAKKYLVISGSINVSGIVEFRIDAL